VTTRERVNDLLTDGLVIAGLCMVIAGMWWIWPPVALIAAGLGCVGLGVWRAQ